PRPERDRGTRAGLRGGGGQERARADLRADRPRRRGGERDAGAERCVWDRARGVSPPGLGRRRAPVLGLPAPLPRRWAVACPARPDRGVPGGGACAGLERSVVPWRAVPRAG